MRKLYIISKLLLIAVVALVGCKRKPLMEECSYDQVARLPIRINWEELNERPQNVTILFYDEATDELVLEHLFEHNSKEIQSYAFLPEGSYKAVIFNELRDQVADTRCDGHEDFNTLEFNLLSRAPIMSRGESLPYVGQPDQLAVQVIEGIDITPEVIEYTIVTYADGTTKGDGDIATEGAIYQSEKLLDVIPILKTMTLTIELHVKGLDNALMPTLVDLINVAEHYNVDNDDNSQAKVRQQFTMNNRTYYEGSKTEGFVTTRVVNFGALGERFTMEDQPDESPLLLDVLFMLVDEEQTIVERVYDITDRLEYLDYPEQTDVRNHVKVVLYDDEALPEVEVGGDGDGLNTDMNEWGVVEVPLGEDN